MFYRVEYMNLVRLVPSFFGAIDEPSHALYTKSEVMKVTPVEERIGKKGPPIKPKRTVDPDDTLTPAEAKIVRRGLDQLKRGESKPWRAVKNALSL